MITEEQLKRWEMYLSGESCVSAGIARDLLAAYQQIRQEKESLAKDVRSWRDAAYACDQKLAPLEAELAALRRQY